MKIKVLNYQEIAQKLNIPESVLRMQYNNPLNKVHESYMGKVIETRVYDNGDAILINDICLEKYEWEAV